MSLKEKISQDAVSALKSGATEESATLRFLSSAIKNKELEKRTKLSKEGEPAEELEKLSRLTDEEVVSVIMGEMKKRKESITQYEKGGRADLAKKESAELEILKKYVPEGMSEEELANLIRQKIAGMGEVSMKDFGKVMGMIMGEVKGKVSGDDVKRILENELAK